MYKLKVKVSKRRWGLGINEYATIEDAQRRVAEMAKAGIQAIVVNSDGSKLK